jgi:hypothetical protein
MSLQSRTLQARAIRRRPVSTAPRALRSLLAAAAALALAACDDVLGLDRCDGSETITSSVSAVGVTRMVVTSAAGELRLLGRPDVRDVRLTGTACAARESDLDGVVLRIDRSGDVIYVDVELDADDTRLDLTIDLPDDLVVDVEHHRGYFEARRVGPLLLTHGDGDLFVDDVAGDVDVYDEGGDVEIRRVLGDVHLSDGSGSALIDDVRGFVDVDRKRSGDLWLRGVTGSVLVRDDGAGDITADGIGGDLTVARDRGGRVRYSAVRGRVTLP